MFPPGTLVKALAVVLSMVTLTVVFASCGDDMSGPSSATCSDCPGSVSWDSSVERCRTNANGQFVKSCCCGY